MSLVDVFIQPYLTEREKNNARIQARAHPETRTYEHAHAHENSCTHGHARKTRLLPTHRQACTYRHARYPTQKRSYAHAHAPSSLLPYMQTRNPRPPILPKPVFVGVSARTKSLKRTHHVNPASRRAVNSRKRTHAQAYSSTNKQAQAHTCTHARTSS